MSAHVLTVGETLGSAVAQSVGRLAHNDPFLVSIGGAESNVAIGLARLGVETTWISRVGADSFGDLIRRELRAEGVTCRALVDEERRTGFMLKERLAGGASRITYYREGSAASRMASDDVTDQDLDAADLVHLTGITCALSEQGRHLVTDVARRARDRGVVVSFDLNYRRRLWEPSEAAAVYEQVLPWCDVVFAGESEAALVVGAREMSGEDAAEFIAKFGPETVVVKHGADGATGWFSGQAVERPAYTVPVIDAVGAGDAFAAGFIAAYLDGSLPEECMRAGVGSGALACTSPGDWEGAGTATDLEQLIAGHDDR